LKKLFSGLLVILKFRDWEPPILRFRIGKNGRDPLIANTSKKVKSFTV